VLWDLDEQVGVEHPWTVPAKRVSAVLATLGRDQTRSYPRAHPPPHLRRPHRRTGTQSYRLAHHTS